MVSNRRGTLPKNGPLKREIQVGEISFHFGRSFNWETWELDSGLDALPTEVFMDLGEFLRKCQCNEDKNGGNLQFWGWWRTKSDGMSVDVAVVFVRNMVNAKVLKNDKQIANWNGTTCFQWKVLKELRRCLNTWFRDTLNNYTNTPSKTDGWNLKTPFWEGASSSKYSFVCSMLVFVGQTFVFKVGPLLLWMMFNQLTHLNISIWYIIIYM